MTIRMSISTEGKIKITTGPVRVRLEDLDKWLGRNPDAILVKLKGHPAVTARYKVGHLCRIEEDDDGQNHNVFVGKHFLGQLPDEAIAFAKQVDMDPESIIPIVGKIEEDGGTFIYIAE